VIRGWLIVGGEIVASSLPIGGSVGSGPFLPDPQYFSPGQWFVWIPSAAGSGATCILVEIPIA
jgi:hypothetical protein